MPLDLASFDAPLWVIPMTPVVAAPEPPPAPAEPPVKLQLIGIVQDSTDGCLRAAIYDPKTDRIYLVLTGEQVGTCTVRAVTEASVELGTARSVTTLVLDDTLKRGRKGGRP